MPYTTEDDLVRTRPNILTLASGLDIDELIAEADSIIDRAIEVGWYRSAALDWSLNWRETPFDATKLSNAATQLTRLGTYKTLEVIYTALMNDAPEEDAFDRQRQIFGKQYKDELTLVLQAGLDYDWSGDDTLAADERANIPTRRLSRC